MSIPFQATHTADDGRYYMVDCCEWFYANHMGHWKRHWSGAPAGLKELAKKPWSGPEDGLPPVGEVVEVFDCSHAVTKRFNNQMVTIVAHHKNRAVFEAGDCDYHGLVKSKFRRVRTAEELAPENRETAIRELMDIAQVDCRVTAARLVDAGFKREVV